MIRLTRHGMLIFTAALVALIAVAVGSAAQPPRTVPDGALEDVNPALTPFGLTNNPITVIAELPGEPIVARDAAAKDAGKGGLSREEKQRIREQLKAQQAPVAQQIQSLGGQVLATYQAAYNGVKAKIPAKKAPDVEALPGVVAVHRVPTYRPVNVRGVPLIGAPQAWDGANGYHGEGIKIAIIDTGIDYTHADFGGPGTTAAWEYAVAHSTVDPASDPQLAAEIGPNAPRVKGGTDLVGNDYNADDPTSVPNPDPNPLDCNGHGSHVAGTAAGSGVLSDGSTYTGPYNASTIASHDWNVGPGVAPKADIYSIRVFGCTGSTNVVVDAIEWAVDHEMDVINMSLGSDFGTKDTPDAVAVDNASRDGVIVVSASGNAGHAPYITSSPGSGTRGISVAAMDPIPSFPGALLHLSTGTDIQAIDANDFAPLPSGPFGIQVIWANASHTQIGLGCSVAEDAAFGPLTGKFIVVARGTCARVAKAIYGQQAGAAGVIMVNNSPDFPPFEGKITSNPDTGEPFVVTIPFLGVQGGPNPSTSANGIALRNADGGSLTLDPVTLSNPGYRALASFTSFGPRSGDSALKPDVTAPGVSISSVAMGSGTGAEFLSGTSMATPHTAGMAALVRQAHPTWRRVEFWKAAVVNTANPAGVAGYTTRGAGAGLIQAFESTHTSSVALGDPGTATVSFGFSEIDRDFSGTEKVTVRNFGSTPVTFDIADTLDQGSPHSVAFGRSSIRVPAGDSRDFNVRLSVPVATAGDSFAFHDVAGVITLTPASSSDNGGITLRVPYYLVPQAVSHVAIGSGQGDAGDRLRAGDNTVTLTNRRGAATGYADWFAWGLKEGRGKGLGSDDLVSAGLQSYPAEAAPSGGGTGWALFALSVARRWSNPAEDEFDVLVDVNADGNPDYDVVAIDLGAITTGSFNGTDAVAVFPIAADGTFGSGSIRYLAGANLNGTSMELPVDFSQLCSTGYPCVSDTTPIRYTVLSFGIFDGTADDFGAATATYDLFHPAFTTASGSSSDVIPPGASVDETVTIDAEQWAATPQLGLMVVSQNNPSRTGRSDEDQSGNGETMTLKVRLAR